MISISPKITSESKVEETVTVTVNKEPEVKKPKAEQPKADNFKDCVPANWIITPDGDMITARNNNSGETFKGTIAEFNTKLRG